MTSNRAQPPSRVPPPGWAYRLGAWMGLAVMRLQRWQFDIRGTEHLPPSGGCVIAANHNSFWDFFAVGRAPYLMLGRAPRILAKQSLFELPLFGWLMRKTGCIPVDRGAGLDAVQHAVHAVEAGEMVLIMPEGTISRSFDLLTFRTGAARIATEAHVPLIPAVSWGTHRFHTSGRRPRWSWKLPVTVCYGEPVRPDAGDDPVAVTDELRIRIETMLDQAVCEYRDGTPGRVWWVPARLGGGAPNHESVESEFRSRRRRWRRRRSG